MEASFNLFCEILELCKETKGLGAHYKASVSPLVRAPEI